MTRRCGFPVLSITDDETFVTSWASSRTQSRPPCFAGGAWQLPQYCCRIAIARCVVLTQGSVVVLPSSSSMGGVVVSTGMQEPARQNCPLGHVGLHALLAVGSVESDALPAPAPVAAPESSF